MTWLPPVVTVEPATEPLTATEVKAQARIDGTDSDDLLDSYIVAARAFVEDYCGIKLVSQTVVLRCSSFCDLIDLPIAPVTSVASITYLDSAGAEQTLAGTVYEGVLHGLEPHIRLKINQSWPSIRSATDAIRVTVSAGYSTVPEPIKHAMLMLIANWFDSRSIGDIPEGAKSLLTNFRRF